RDLQEAHRQRLTATGRDYNRTDSTEQLDQKIRSLRLKVERLEGELQQVDEKLAVTGNRLGRWLVLVAVLGVAAMGAVGYVGWRQHIEHQAAEAARQEAQGIQQVQREIAEGLLQELVNDKTITAEEARRHALTRLSVLRNLPPAEIQSLIDRKIAP